MQRDHNREPCLFCEEDYSAQPSRLDEALDECSCALHAYTLMTNDVTWLTTPREAATVPKRIISLGRRYVQYINRGDRRTGTLRRPLQVPPYRLQDALARSPYMSGD